MIAEPAGAADQALLNPGNVFRRQFNAQIAARDHNPVRDLKDLIEFRTERRVKTRVVTSDHMISDLLCYEPGQGTPEHHHIGEDEVFYVIEGSGTITNDGEAIDVEAKSVVFSPAESRRAVPSRSPPP